MNLVINLDHWTNLSPWKRRSIRYVMGNLNLGTPALGEINGTQVAVFSDARFTPEHATR